MMEVCNALFDWPETVTVEFVQDLISNHCGESSVVINSRGATYHVTVYKDRVVRTNTEHHPYRSCDIEYFPDGKVRETRNFMPEVLLSSAYNLDDFITDINTICDYNCNRCDRCFGDLRDICQAGYGKDALSNVTSSVGVMVRSFAEAVRTVR